jgi:hypothetical protein
MDLPQNTGTQDQPVKNPHFPNSATCSGFCSGLKGDSIHFRMTIPFRVEMADFPITIDSLDVLQGGKEI